MTRPDTTATQSHESSAAQRHPTITFTPSLENTKGVKDITRKVIRQLEGLGHLDTRAMYEDSEDGGTPVVSGTSTRRSSITSSSANGHTNGHAAKPVDQPIDFEIPRKLLHSSIGFFTYYLYVGEGNPNRVVVALWSALCVIYPADVLRFRSRRFSKLYERFLGFLMRESERHSVNGVIWYILGVNFVLTCYPLDIAVVSILILSWADTAASTFGRLYGRRTPKLPKRILGLPLAPRKSVAGFVAATVTGAVIAAGFWGVLATSRFGGQEATWTWEGGVRGAGGGGALGLLLIGIVAGAVTGVAEALDLGSVDDNLTLPIISGGCLCAFFKLWEFGASWFSS